MPELIAGEARSVPARPRWRIILLGLLALGSAGLAWVLLSTHPDATSRVFARPPATLQALDARESGGTWAVRGVLQEEERLRLLQNGIRCYQFDSRSW